MWWIQFSDTPLPLPSRSTRTDLSRFKIYTCGQISIVERHGIEPCQPNTGRVVYSHA